MKDWKVQHKQILTNFLTYLNSISDKYILKGGTSLMLCYNLDRFSEDIDLDGFSKDIFSIVDNFCKAYSQKINKEVTYRIAKDTDTVKRVIIHYGNSKPLKVEVSYRKKTADITEYTKINAILVYNILSIFLMKLNAYNGRDKIRDLYDLVFIYMNYKQYLNSTYIMMLREAVSYKGLDYVDYIVKTQKDELIDIQKLENNFLQMYYDLGLQ